MQEGKIKAETNIKINIEGVDNEWCFLSNVDRLYVSREDGGRGLISCERCVRGEENSLE